jgi:hypothetical protein
MNQRYTRKQFLVKAERVIFEQTTHVANIFTSHLGNWGQTKGQ